MNNNDGKEFDYLNQNIGKDNNPSIWDDDTEDIKDIKKEWKKKQRRAYQKSQVQEKKIQQSRKLSKTIISLLAIVGVGVSITYLLSQGSLEVVEELIPSGDEVMGLDTDADGNNLHIDSVNNVCENQDDHSCVEVDNNRGGGIGQIVDNIQKINQTSQEHNRRLEAVIEMSDGKEVNLDEFKD
ncbi:hypothetical protein Cyast_0414 [Cyanobacterium stanieri PCC 7202]|uniref:Uncharacterized protein n=1 Tax=Cyanobacterium stanieri (strain ATCC 29140 / PCC 7202) TaxID=292563 RepID=K9YHS4_CYASC|nr:hypothetical protein Cyast_0414 [Cyanobacterium stanieri PCC 7202]